LIRNGDIEKEAKYLGAVSHPSALSLNPGLLKNIYSETRRNRDLLKVHLGTVNRH